MHSCIKKLLVMHSCIINARFLMGVITKSHFLMHDQLLYPLILVLVITPFGPGARVASEVESEKSIHKGYAPIVRNHVNLATTI